MLYQPGDYVCVSTKYPPWIFWDYAATNAIKWFTHSKYSHSFIVTSDTGEIVEARPTGATRAHISEYSDMPMICSTTPLTDTQRGKIVESAISYIGTPYGFLDIVYLGLYTQGIQWQWMLNEILESPDMICSQLVAQAGLSAGVTEWLCGRPDPQLVVPGDLASLAQRGA